ncbi:MAG: glycogen/starch synthase [bacterium]|nr:glycogen/starch synthase [bacterium]
MKITHVVAEIYPLAAVGGYSKVVEALTEKQSEESTVNVITPYYSTIPSAIKRRISDIVSVSIKDNGEIMIIEYAILKVSKNKTIFLIHNKDYYQYRTNVYGYTDDANRWAYLSYSALKLVEAGIIETDIIHTHDWHTGILQNFKDQYFPNLNISIVFTIHNLKFQAMFDHRSSDLQNYDKYQGLYDYKSTQLQKLNFLKRAIKYADRCVFVSKGYMDEVLSGINDELLLPILTKQKKNLSYVLNGVDQAFNPLDCNIYSKYDKHTFVKKNQNKEFLQKKLKLIVSNQVALICFVGRLTEQKGISLLIEILPVILRNSNAQFVLLGGGDSNYLPRLREIEKEFKGRVYIYGKSDFDIAPQVFASSDLCLVPSIFEPCGIVPMEAQIFGCEPIVHSTGGLKDTTIDYNLDKLKATGFVFKNNDKDNFVFIISQALELYQNKSEWQKIVTNAMSQDFSWDKSALEYMKIYYLH